MARKTAVTRRGPARKIGARRTRLCLERLEDRTLLTDGPWLLSLAGLPGGTRQDQIAAAKTLIHNAQLDDAAHNLQVTDTVGPHSLLLLQAPPDVSARDLTAELSAVPGFRYVVPSVFQADPSAPNGSNSSGGADSGSSDGVGSPPPPAAGTWTPLTHLAPAGTGTMMLLSDGRVLVQGPDNASVKTWYALTPDSTGSYVNGTWSQLASMNLERLYFGSNVLPDGRVFVVGGEYSGPFTSQNFTALSE